MTTADSLTLTVSSADNCRGKLYFPSNKNGDLNITPVYYTENPLKLLGARISSNTKLTSIELIVLTGYFALMIIFSCYFLAVVCENLLGRKVGAGFLIVMWLLVWTLTLFADNNKMIDYAHYKLPLTVTQGI